MGVEIAEERRLNEHLFCPNGRNELLLFIPFRYSPFLLLGRAAGTHLTDLTDPAFGIPRSNQTGN